MKEILIKLFKKFLAFFLLPLAFAGWLVVSCICSIFIGFGIGMAVPFRCTFDEDYNIFVGGIGKAFIDSKNIVKEYWKFNTNSYFSYLPS